MTKDLEYYMAEYELYAGTSNPLELIFKLKREGIILILNDANYYGKA